MTRRNRAGSTPCALGRYYTDDRLAAAIVDELDRRGLVDFAAARYVLEPSAGGGAFVRALAALRARRGYTFAILACDVDARANAAAFADRFAVFDFLDPTAWPADWPDRVDATIGNPPYSVKEHRHDKAGALIVHPPDHKLAGQPVEVAVEVGTDHALRCLEVGTRAALLFRHGFAGGANRYARLWSRGVLWDEIVAVPRPSFTDGTHADSSEYAVFVMDAAGGFPDVRRSWVLWTFDR